MEVAEAERNKLKEKIETLISKKDGEDAVIKMNEAIVKEAD